MVLVKGGRHEKTSSVFRPRNEPKGDRDENAKPRRYHRVCIPRLSEFRVREDPQDGKFQVTSERIHLEHSSLKFNIRILLRFSHDKIWNIITPVFPFSVRLIVILFTNLSLSEDH